LSAIDGFAIVYFGNDWFAENRTSSHHIARLLGQRFPLLYVETPGIRTPAATKRDFKKLWRKLARAFNAPQAVREHVWVTTMPQIPFRRWSLIRKLNLWCGRYLVKRAMRRLGFQNVILWFVVPHPAPLQGQLGEQLSVYYCTDDYSDLPGVDREEIKRLEDQVARGADQVFVTATTMMESRKKLNPTTEYAPHGVDFEHFQRASDPATVLPEGGKSLRRPVIGYFGSIAEWVDTDLFLYLAKARPEWTFLLIGLATVDVSELRKCSNIILTGPQPYEKLPEWAAAFDVALLPFRVNQLTIASNPLKLREYLATGKPVVSSSLPEVELFGDCVSIAHNPVEFIEKIENALTQDCAEAKQARTRAVMGSTWEARLDEVLSTVEEVFLRKQESRKSAALDQLAVETLRVRAKE